QTGFTVRAISPPQNRYNQYRQPERQTCEILPIFTDGFDAGLAGCGQILGGAASPIQARSASAGAGTPIANPPRRSRFGLVGSPLERLRAAPRLLPNASVDDQALLPEPRDKVGDQKRCRELDARNEISQVGRTLTKRRFARFE